MAMRFDATGEKYTRSSGLPTYSACTIMGWFKISVDRNDYSTFFCLDADTAGYPTGLKYLVATNSDGTTLQLYVGDADTVTGSTLTVGTWYHIALTVNGTSGENALVYVNGVLDITQTAKNASSIKILYGESDAENGTEALNGVCAAIKEYDAVLTVEEIQQEMRQYLPMRTANINAFYPMLSDSDDQVDFSGMGNTLTVGGTPTVEDGPPIPWCMGDEFAFVPAAAAPSVFPENFFQLPQPTHETFDVVAY